MKKSGRWTALGLVGVLAPLVFIADGLLMSGPVQAASSPSSPALSWSPSTHGGYDFGIVQAGSATSQKFTLTNSGGTATGALSITLSGSSAFSKAADTCSMVSLGPHKSCSVTVRYAPASAGETDQASLTGMSRKPSAAATLFLIGAAAAQATSSTVSTPSSTSMTFGQSLTDSAVVTGNSGGPAPTGTVSFYVCGPSATTLTSCTSTANPVGGSAVTLTADASNTANSNATSASFTPSAPGSYCFYTVYSGDANYPGSVDGNADQCFSVDQATSSTVSTPSVSTVTFGGSLTDSAVVTGNYGGPAPTGTVSFYVCGPSATTLTSCTSTANPVGGSAVTLTADPSNAATSDATSASFTPPAPGSYCFYAVYSGDANYLGSVDGNADQCFTVTS